MSTRGRRSRLGSPERRANLIVASVGIAAGIAVLAYTAGIAATPRRLNDFYREAWPAYAALAHGHVLGFLQLGPTYGGSLVLRAPFAMVPSTWGGSPRAVYFASALPCMVAAAVFCAWLAAQPRRDGGAGWATRLGPLVYCLFNPLVLIALLGGHPEDILGASLC